MERRRRAGAIEQPFSNHNGGHLAFGPDGYLYVGMGDGGSGNDPGHLAQDPLSLLGKMLRVDVGVPDSHPIGYIVPPDNPFVANPARDEIWSFGWRNPWRFTFDDPSRGGTGAMVADVRPEPVGEIDYEPAGRGGRNYGWRNREARTTTSPRGRRHSRAGRPIYEYDHSMGSRSQADTLPRARPGARRSAALPLRRFIRSRVWSIARPSTPAGCRAPPMCASTPPSSAAPAQLAGVSSFGVDASGELYIAVSAAVVLRVIGQPGTRAICASSARVLCIIGQRARQG